MIEDTNENDDQWENTPEFQAESDPSGQRLTYDPLIRTAGKVRLKPSVQVGLLAHLHSLCGGWNIEQPMAWFSPRDVMRAVAFIAEREGYDYEIHQEVLAAAMKQFTRVEDH